MNFRLPRRRKDFCPVGGDPQTSLIQNKNKGDEREGVRSEIAWQCWDLIYAAKRLGMSCTASNVPF